jgi:hypothetical protein
MLKSVLKLLLMRDLVMLPLSRRLRTGKLKRRRHHVLQLGKLSSLRTFLADSILLWNGI